MNSVPLFGVLFHVYPIEGGIFWTARIMLLFVGTRKKVCVEFLSMCLLSMKRLMPARVPKSSLFTTVFHTVWRHNKDSVDKRQNCTSASRYLRTQSFIRYILKVIRSCASKSLLTFFNHPLDCPRPLSYWPRPICSLFELGLPAISSLIPRFLWLYSPVPLTWRWPWKEKKRRNKNPGIIHGAPSSPLCHSTSAQRTTAATSLFSTRSFLTSNWLDLRRAR